ncbi:KTSC domain-containing protein [Flavobacterium aquatile]|uniref:KTSC domain-containing protein n=1 Tax=Flavobacterium aquatile LMG 4008 = ATCC 11947 TaxID=1453498 RepID=A0A095SWE8_9FLAO|nr:KTSC domain-containing protein [Flavobacterium aquatile]KGD68996.1 hypothetical protein LG45_05000 [Flavobacterium aquatile LMG 4008 = ATCC 11947]OXA65708.1 KTSC domain-containing protein [Flavobacterium aquatile LMG 4008 = ATCC 11947]GEC78151.1 hypothetical protein FAQ01_10210 [Flavobacterium aquatile]
MTKYPVNAKNILKVGFDEEKEILEIEFKLNVIHHYFNVPIDEFVAFMKASDSEEFYFNYIQCHYHFDIF